MKKIILCVKRNFYFCCGPEFSLTPKMDFQVRRLRSTRLVDNFLAYWIAPVCYFPQRTSYSLNQRRQTSCCPSHKPWPADVSVTLYLNGLPLGNGYSLWNIWCLIKTWALSTHCLYMCIVCPLLVFSHCLPIIFPTHGSWALRMLLILTFVK